MVAVMMVMENCGYEPVLLKKGTKLGETTTVEVLTGTDVVEEGNQDCMSRRRECE